MAGTDLQGTGRKKLRKQITGIILLMSLLKFLVHMVVAGNYELHREAYLFFDYANHPEWGYFNNPPVIMIFAGIASKLGGSVWAFRLFPALAGAISMYLVGTLTKELGGKKWAVILATVAYLVTPIFLTTSSLFLPLAFDQLFWFTYLFFFVRMLQTQNKNFWFVLGLVAGVGFLTQYTIVVPVVLTTVFLLATRHRKLIFTPQFWGFLVNIAILTIPNLIWQYNHNWPELENLKVLKEAQLLNLDRGWFIAMQFIMLAPVVFVWIAGLYALFARKDLRQYMVLGFSMVGVVLLMLLLHAKPYYTAPFYMVLLVFGAVQWENWLLKNHKGILATLMVLSILVSLPLLALSLPYKNAEKMFAFSEGLKSYGLNAPFVWADGTTHKLPEDFAKMTGWRSLSEKVDEAYLKIQEEEKMNVVIICEDYGIAASINYYHRKVSDFPSAFSFDGSQMYWAPNSIADMQALIFVGELPDFVLNNFADIEEVGQVDIPYASEYKTKVYRCEWPSKNFDEAYKSWRSKAIAPHHRKDFEH